ncbi:unnamed protein product [Sphagnum tenellum]
MATPAFFDSLGSALIAEEKRSLFSPRCISDIMWAHAVGRHTNTLLFDKLNSFTVDNLLKFSPDQMSTVLWANASLENSHQKGQECTALFKAVADSPFPKLKGFDIRQLQQIAWSFTTVQVPAPRLLKAVGDELITRKLDDVPMDALSDIMLAISKLSGVFSCPHVMSKVAIHLLGRDLNAIDSSDLRSLCEILVSFGGSDTTTLPAYENLFAKSVILFNSVKMEGVSAELMCDVVWAYYKTGQSAKFPSLLHTVSHQLAVRDLSTLPTSSLLHALWSLSVSGFIPAPGLSLHEKIGTQILSRPLQELSVRDMVVLLYSYTASGVKNGELTNLVAREALKRDVKSFDIFACSNAAWALIFSQNENDHTYKLINNLLERAAKILTEEVNPLDTEDSLVPVSVSQLQQVMVELSLRADRMRLNSKGIVAPPMMLKTLLVDKLSALKSNEEAKLFEKEIDSLSAYLKELDVQHCCYQTETRTGYTLPIVLPALKKVIAIIGKGDFYLGSTKLKFTSSVLFRHLTALGMDVVIIPSWEWRQLIAKDSKRDIKLYLLKRILKNLAVDDSKVSAPLSIR